MKLQNGKLYRAATGERFRVTVQDSVASCNGLNWYLDGGSLDNDFARNIVEEIDESRWIPTTLDEIEEYADVGEGVRVRLVNDRHWQRLVSRQSAIDMGYDRQVELAQHLLDRATNISVTRGKKEDVIRIRRAA